MHLEHACKVQVAPAQYVDRTGLQDQEVQHITLAHLAVADVDKVE